MNGFAVDAVLARKLFLACLSVYTFLCSESERNSNKMGVE